MSNTSGPFNSNNKIQILDIKSRSQIAQTE